MKTPAHAYTDLYLEWDGAITRHQKDANTTIISIATAGASYNDPVWLMYQVYDDGTDMYKKFADGNNNFDNVEADWNTKVFS